MVACVHLTTDLWTIKSKHSYIGVTGTWLTKDFEFKENLSSLAYMITINNTTNMIKGMHILKSQLSEVTRQDRSSQLEVEKLNRLCLTIDEKILLKAMINLLSPFEIVTWHICGAKYSILNLVHPYIEILKKKFQPRFEKNKMIDSYLILIYGELEDLFNQLNIEKLSNTDDSSSVSKDKNILTAVESGDINKIEYLLPTNTLGLLNKVQAAIYLLLDKLIKLRELYKNIKDNLQLQDQNQASNITSKNNTLEDDNFFAKVFNLGESNNDNVIKFDKDE
ncbi:36_t:CDS:2, partial [Gigaspora margarita]